MVNVMAQMRSASVLKQGMKSSMSLVLVHAGREDLKIAVLSNGALEVHAHGLAHNVCLSRHLNVFLLLFGFAVLANTAKVVRGTLRTS